MHAEDRDGKFLAIIQREEYNTIFYIQKLKRMIPYKIDRSIDIFDHQLLRF